MEVDLVRVPDAEFAQRRDRAAAAAREAGLDGLLVCGRSSGTLDNLGNVHWLTRHYHVPPIITPTGFWRSYGLDMVLIDADGNASLLVVGVTDPPVIDDVRTAFDMEALLIETLRERGLDSGRVGLAGTEVLGWSAGERLRRELPGLTFEPCDLMMARLRLTLSDAECEMVRQSCRVGSAILTAGMEAAVEGATDGDVAAAGLAVAARSPRTQHWNFIMSSGERAADYASGSLPSWDPTTPYRAGDIIHPDCYGYVDGYMYDVQRTAVVGGNPTPEQAYMIDHCWEMVHVVGDAMHDGITPREIHAVAAKYRKEHGAGFDDAWAVADHVGHGYASGFDWPWLGPRADGADDPMVAPFAVTIELWWSKPGLGAAVIEDDYLVTPDGPENLTAAVPKAIPV
jgi:Xaa-Pro aminopeptidase